MVDGEEDATVGPVCITVEPYRNPTVNPPTPTNPNNERRVILRVKKVSIRIHSFGYFYISQFIFIDLSIF